MKREYYALTQSQQMVLLNYESSVLKQCTNICQVIDLEEEMDSKLLLQAVYVAVFRNPSAGIRLGMQDGRIVQYFSEETPGNIEFLDYSGRTLEELEAAYEDWSRIPFPNDSMDVQLYRLKVIRKSSGRLALYFCVSHMIYDRYSLMALMKDIMYLYLAMQNHKPLPVKGYSPVAVFKAEAEYQNSPRNEEDILFWKEVFQEEPVLTDVNGNCLQRGPGQRFGRIMERGRQQADLVDYRIPELLSAAVLDYARQRHVSPQSLYLLAVRSFLSQVCGCEDVLIVNMVARRGTLTQKRAGGTMENAIPFRTVFSNTLCFAQACEVMSQYQNAYYRHAGMAYSDILKLIGDKFHLPEGMGYHTVSLTYQPLLISSEQEIPFSFRKLSGKAASVPLDISIIPVDAHGKLTAYYEYLTYYIKPETILFLHNFILKFLVTGLKNPETPVCEILQKIFRS